MRRAAGELSFCQQVLQRGAVGHRLRQQLLQTTVLVLEALQEARRIDAPGGVYTHTIRAMICGQLGPEEEARGAARRILELDPDFEENAWYELQLRNFPEHMAEGLRKAGLDSCAAASAIAPGRLVSVDSEIGQVSWHMFVSARILPLRTSDLWGARPSLPAQANSEGGLMATVAAEVEGPAVRPTSAKLTLSLLISLVIGSMTGGGVFKLPSDMSTAAAPGAIIIGWLITASAC